MKTGLYLSQHTQYIWTDPRAKESRKRKVLKERERIEPVKLKGRCDFDWCQY